MTKNTAKLQAALDILGREYNQSIPNRWTYAEVEQMGYTWDGSHWSRPERPHEIGYPVLLRLTGERADIDGLADVIARALQPLGYVVTVKTASKNRENEGWRIYAEIE